MKIEHALRVLGLTSLSTTGDLNSAFRKLAKKYHPDFNQGNEALAHKRMTELNLAYETALEYFTSVYEAETDAEISSDLTFITKLNRAVSQVFEGIYTYYQYGLENVHLRNEGTRKFRYSESIKYIRHGISSLETLKPLAVTESKNEYINLIIDFSKAFLQSMLIKRHHIPSSNAIENNAHKHYRQGSSHLDYAIKDALFGDRLIQIRKGTFYSKISLGYEEFMLVVTRYYKSSWVSETLLKIYLLDIFTKVIQLLNKMRY